MAEIFRVGDDKAVPFASQVVKVLDRRLNCASTMGKKRVGALEKVDADL